ncbi:MAG: hypothetical protein ACYS8W_10315 [Planctomycetota bacterium]
MTKVRLILIALALFAFSALAAAGLSGAKKEFSKAVKDKDFERAGKALKDAAADDGKKSADWIIKTAVKQENHLVYRAATEALASMKSAAAIGCICKQARGRAVEAKILCVNAMEKMSDDKTAALLRAMLKDRDERVVREAVIAIGERKIRDNVGALISTLKKYEKEEGLTYVCLLRSLVRIAYLGDELRTAAQWKEYWEREKPRNIDDPLLEGGAWKRKSLRVLRDIMPPFFNRRVESKRVLFIIDSTAAMEADAKESRPRKKEGEEPEKESRWLYSVTRLLLAIKQLDKSAEFDVMLCGKSPSTCFGKLTPARQKDVDKAVKFLEEAKTEKADAGGPDLEGALKKAAKYKNITAVYLVLGGPPTDAAEGGEISCEKAMGEAVNSFLDGNIFSKVRVNVFAWWMPSSEEEVVRKLWPKFLDYSKKLAEYSDGLFEKLPGRR